METSMFNEALKSMKTSCLCFYQCCCLCFLQPPHIGIRILKVVGRNEKVKHLFTTCRLTQKYYLSLLFNIPWNYNSIFYIYAFVLSTFYLFFSLYSPISSFFLYPVSRSPCTQGLINGFSWLRVCSHTPSHSISLLHSHTLTHTYIHNNKTLRCFKM